MQKWICLDQSAPRDASIFQLQILGMESLDFISYVCPSRPRLLPQCHHALQFTRLISRADVSRKAVQGVWTVRTIRCCTVGCANCVNSFILSSLNFDQTNIIKNFLKMTIFFFHFDRQIKIKQIQCKTVLRNWHK